MDDSILSDYIMFDSQLTPNIRSRFLFLELNLFLGRINGIFN